MLGQIRAHVMSPNLEEQATKETMIAYPPYTDSSARLESQELKGLAFLRRLAVTCSVCGLHTQTPFRLLRWWASGLRVVVYLATLQVDESHGFQGDLWSLAANFGQGANSRHSHPAWSVQLLLRGSSRYFWFSVNYDTKRHAGFKTKQPA